METLNQLDFFVDNVIASDEVDLAIDAFSNVSLIQRRIEESGVEALIGDYERLLESSLSFYDYETEAILKVRNAFRSIQSIAEENLQELPSQLRARLDQYDHTFIRHLMDDLKNWDNQTWLDPQLPSLAKVEAQNGTFLKRHGALVNLACFADNGRRLISAGLDSQIIVWDLEQNSAICRVPTNGNVQALAAAESAPILTWVSQSHLTPLVAYTAVVWNTDYDIEVCKLAGHIAPVCSCTVSADGRRAATIDQEGLLIAWQLPSGREIGRRAYQARANWNIQMSRSGSHILLAATLRGFADEVLKQLGFSDSKANPSSGDFGKHGMGDAQLTVLSVSEGLREIWRHSFDQSFLFSMSDRLGSLPVGNHFLSPDGRQIALLLAEEIQVFDISKNSLNRSISLPNSHGLRATLLVDKNFKRFGLADTSGKVTWGSLCGSQPVTERSAGSWPNFHIGLAMTDPLSHQTVYALDDGSILVFPPQAVEADWRSFVAPEARDSLDIGTLAVPVAVSASGDRFARILRPPESKMEVTKDLAVRFSPREWAVQIQDSRSQTPLYVMPLGREQPMSLEFSNDGTLLLCNLGTHIVLWTLEGDPSSQRIENPVDHLASSFDIPINPDERSTYCMIQKHMSQWQTAIFSRDDQFIAACTGNGFVSVWSIPKGIWQTSFHSGLFGCTALSFVPETSLLCVGGQSAKWLGKLQGQANGPAQSAAAMFMLPMAPGAIHVWDYSLERITQEIELEGLKVCQLEVKEDGSEGISVTSQGKLDRWRIDSGEIIASFFVSRFVKAECLSLSLDGRFAATGAADGVVRVWDIDSEAMLAGFTTGGAIHSLAASKRLDLIVTSNSMGWLHVLRSSTHSWSTLRFSDLPENELYRIATDPKTPDYLYQAATRALGSRGLEGALTLARVLDRVTDFPRSRTDRLLRSTTQALKKLAAQLEMPAEVMDSLERALDRETDTYLIGYLLVPLSEIDMPSATRLISQSLSSPIPADRHQASLILTARKEHAQRSVEPLKQAAATETEPVVLSQIMTALGHLSTEDAMQALVELAASPRDEIAIAALEAISERPTLELLDLFSAPPEGASVARQKALIKGLGKIGFIQYRDALAEFNQRFGNSLLKHLGLDSRARSLVTNMLLKKSPAIGHCVELIGKYLEDPISLEVRCDAITNLGTIKISASASLLLAQLENPSTEIRLAAVAALEGLEEPRVLWRISEQIFRDPDPKVRQSCVATLASFPDDSVEVLLQALDDPEPEVRQTVLKTLADLGALEALLPLFRLANDSNLVVKMSALEAIRTISKNFVARLFAGQLDRKDREALKELQKELQAVDRPEIMDTWKVILAHSPDRKMVMAWLNLALSDASPESREKLLKAVGKEASKP